MQDLDRGSTDGGAAAENKDRCRFSTSSCAAREEGEGDFQSSVYGGCGGDVADTKKKSSKISGANEITQEILFHW